MNTLKLLAILNAPVILLIIRVVHLWLFPQVELTANNSAELLALSLDAAKTATDEEQTSENLMIIINLLIAFVNISENGFGVDDEVQWPL